MFHEVLKRTAEHKGNAGALCLLLRCQNQTQCTFPYCLSRYLHRHESRSHSSSQACSTLQCVCPGLFQTRILQSCWERKWVSDTEATHSAFIMASNCFFSLPVFPSLRQKHIQMTSCESSYILNHENTFSVGYIMIFIMVQTSITHIGTRKESLHIVLLLFFHHFRIASCHR